MRIIEEPYKKTDATTLKFNSIRSYQHQLHSIESNKTGLSNYDNKRYYVSNNESYPHGHYKIRTRALIHGDWNDDYFHLVHNKCLELYLCQFLPLCMFYHPTVMLSLSSRCNCRYLFFNTFASSPAFICVSLRVYSLLIIRFWTHMCFSCL